MIYSSIKHNRKLYGGVAALSVILVIAAMGGGLFQQPGFWMADWQHRAFRLLCHQDPARSFWINSKPMAVCTRCFGIYAGFSLLWLGMPVLASTIEQIKQQTGKLLFGAIAVNLIDVVGNLLEVWQNTTISRTAAGTLIGISTVLFLADKFITKTNNSNRGVYGIERVSNFRS